MLNIKLFGKPYELTHTLMSMFLNVIRNNSYKFFIEFSRHSIKFKTFYKDFL